MLGLPSPPVLDRIRKAWREDRKPANVLLVLDTSGSMNDENRLKRAKDGLDAFLREVSPNDRVGLTIFSDRVQPLVPIAPVRTNKRKLQSTISDLIADGGTAFHDATAEGVETVKRLNDNERINAVVMLTDGEDTDSSLTIDEVVRDSTRRATASRAVRVFTIAFSASALGRRGGARADRRGVGREGLPGLDRGHRDRLPVHLELLLVGDCRALAGPRQAADARRAQPAADRQRAHQADAERRRARGDRGRRAVLGIGTLAI